MKNAIMKILGISEVSYYRWKKERLIFGLLTSYFSKDELEEYIDTGRIERYDLIKNLTTDELRKKLLDADTSSILTLPLLEDFASISLHKKIEVFFKRWDFTKYFPKRQLVKVLGDIFENLSFSAETSKDILIDSLEKYQTSLKNFEHSNHSKILIDFVRNDLSKIEVYLLIKYNSKYL